MYNQKCNEMSDSCHERPILNQNQHIENCFVGIYVKNNTNRVNMHNFIQRKINPKHQTSLINKLF